MIPSFVIFLREGIEASMIVAIFLAYLNKRGLRQHFKDIFLGVAAALAFAFGAGIAAFLWIDHYNGSHAQLIFEAFTFLLAAMVLTYMTFWMQSHSRSMSQDLRARSDEVLKTQSRWGIAFLAFTTVSREALETMVFMLAIIFARSSQRASSGSSTWLFVGAVAGLVVAMAIAFGIYKLGLAINLKRFFQVLGILLMIFAAGLLSDAVQAFQELGWLPFGQQVLWNTQGVIQEASVPGDVLHSLLGYADRPTLLQFTVWLVYLVLGISWYVRESRVRRPLLSQAKNAPVVERDLSKAQG